MRRVLLLSLTALLAASCATNPALENLPDRRIDRTIENTRKINDWSVIAIGAVSQTPLGEIKTTLPLPWPFYYRDPAVSNALSVFDQGFFSLNVPVPNEDSNYSVVTLSWTPSNDGVFGYNNQYTLGVTRRQPAGPDHAFDYGLSVTDMVYDEGFSVYLARFALATEWQLGDHLWLRPGVSASVFQMPGRQKVIGNLRYTMSEGIFAEYPLTVEAALDFNKFLGLRAGYSLYWLGRTNGSWDQKYSIGTSVVF